MRSSGRRRSTTSNGDIPRFLANGDGPPGLRWRRRVRCGLRANGDVLGWALRLPTADSLCSLKVARASKISGRKFSAAARRKPTGLNVCRIGDRKGIAAARNGFLLAALHSVAKRVSRGQAHHPTRCCPRLPEDRTARLRRHDQQLRSPCTSHRGMSLRWRPQDSASGSS